jgi:predicted nuclease of restriction endonuclease-like (RecB) superfamily
MKTTFAITPEYAQFVAELKARIHAARLNAARAVNGDLILLYWDIGRALAEKQQHLGWGEAVVERLAADLRRAFPDSRGFSSDNVWRMRQFYREYSAPDFLEQVVREIHKPSGRHVLEQAVPETESGVAPCHVDALPTRGAWELLASVPWGHHVLLIKKVKDPAARIYYLRATARFGWSRNVLLNQIKAGAYQRAVLEKKTHNFPLALPEHLAEQADEMLKSRYNLEFLGIHHQLHERELEDRLIAQLERFILELGYGFCFIGRQYRLALGAKEYFVDLLFYHRFLKALVAFDLKIAEFQPEFAGKMDFYLNLLNKTERGPGDQPSIGIILCAEKDSLAVEFALKSKTNPIGVAEYQLRPRLPAAYKGKLPSAKQLADAMRPVLPGAALAAQPSSRIP